MDSPVSVGSDEAEFKSKKHRRGSLERAKSKEERKSSVDDDDVTLQKVPKLKIKLGQPPAASKQGARQRQDGDGVPSDGGANEGRQPTSFPTHHPNKLAEKRHGQSYTPTNSR